MIGENSTDAGVSTRYVASVVVCVKEDPRVLRLLKSLELQTIPRDQFQVIVVAFGDNRYLTSIDDTTFDLRIIRVDQAGHAFARNVGLRAVEAPIFISTDADCVAGRNWISDFVAAFELAGSDTVALGGSIHKLLLATMVQQRGITIDNGQRTLNYLPALHLPYVTGANAAYRTGSALEIGGYDEVFKCGEDVDLSYRLQLAGGLIDIISGADIYHEDRSTLKEHYDRFFRYAIDQALLFKKYRPISGRRANFNCYPWKRLRDAIGGFAGAASRDTSLGELAETFLVTAVEALGVVAGDLRGSITHHVLYI